ncbi:MAG: 1-deoxy-D-xylulose-5-phosphate reductoisomerase [Proteobacteria bacterium]|nr:1-deoxy-D-xylulose-5-phosphate reductoisomerase [Pseudomonadota bacterium]
MKNITILGSTGSIGLTTLDVIRSHRDEFNIVGLSGNSNYTLLAQQANEFKPGIIGIGDKDLVNPLRNLLSYKPEIITGEDGLVSVVRNSNCDLLLNALVGAVGLLPTMEALKLSINVALANKETLVIGGELVTELAKKNKVHLIPVDSEHNAIFQCLRGNGDREAKNITLTGSGGPLLNYPLKDFDKVTPKEALNHPTWGMGKKISIDSATMVNKGLEIIEARWFFGFSTETIDVVIHPQSIVHGMVEFSDGSYLAMLGPTSMSVPIIYSLYYPDYAKTAPVDSLKSCRDLSLTFIEPDLKRYPALKTAREVAKTLGTAPAVFNASNEIAVQAFLDGKIKFTQIIEVINKTLDKHKTVYSINLDVLLETDRWARATATNMIN